MRIDKSDWLVFVMIYIALMIGFSVGHVTACHNTRTVTETDTVVVRDVIYKDKPTPTYRQTVRTILLPITDTTTISVRDTIYAPLPVEEVEYRDSLYYAVVSGYKPVLEHLEIYPETKVITRTVTARNERKWHVGVQAGYGVTTNGLSPYVGVGITYDIFNF